MTNTSTRRFTTGQRVTVQGDVYGGVSGKLPPIPDGEAVTVFEDYGQPHINVMRDNGQLRSVPRRGIALAVASTEGAK